MSKTKLKLKKLTKKYYDYHELEKLVEIKSGKRVRNWADKWGPNGWSTRQWAEKHGYDTKCLDYKSLSTGEDWPENSPEMALRIKINTEYMKAEDGEKAELPYLDFWHYAMDNIFYDIHNGSYHYFNPQECLEAVKDSENVEESGEWVREILRLFVEVFKENKLPDEVEVYISW